MSEDHLGNDLKSIIANASKELFVVAPALDADFVASYLTHTSRDLSIRLLTSDRCLHNLLPAIENWVEHHAGQIQVRSTTDIHDSCLIVDMCRCYQSALSFDSEANTTAINQIIDAFAAVRDVYEQLWDRALIEFPHPGM